ncbi:MAG TPA: hypothetical protein VKB50_20580 [Vicinamibacterales bacterium]|nr:hypothetical protein [Vicinamibacterales bacterium]
MSDGEITATDILAIDEELFRSTAAQGYGVTDGGFVPKPFGRLLAEKLALARTVFGDDVDLTPASAIRKILEVTALEDARTWTALGAMYDNQFVSSARGDALSRLGEELGLPRPFLQARGSIRLTPTLPDGTNELFVPRGARLMTAGNHHVATTDSVVLTRTGGAKDVGVEAFYPGPEHNLDPNVSEAGANPQKIAFWNPADTKLAALKAAAGANPLESVVAIAHTRTLTGGELRWPDARYRDLLLRAPRSTWSVEAIRIAASLVPGVRRVVVRDGGGLDVEQSIFGTFNFAERVFGAERDIVSPNFFTVLVALDGAAIFEGPEGVRVSIESVIEDLRPIGIYPRVQEAHRVFAGVAADLVVTGIPLPRTSTAVVNDSDAAKNFKRALLDRVQRYIDTLDFGEPVRFSEVTFALMSEPGLADVRNLRLLRSPPRLGAVKELGGRIFSELPLGENLTVGVSEIAMFADDFALMTIV